MTRTPGAAFFEEQPLRNNKLFFLAFVSGVGMIVFFAYAMYKQLVVGEPFGDRPMGDTGLLVFGSLYILLGIALLYLYFAGRLVTEVRSEGLFIRYVPFHRAFTQIPLDGVTSCEARTYKPIREYGGWGIRRGLGKKAYNVSGNQGVELQFEDGSKLLIGSNKASQLAAALESIIH
ncbi:MAG: hypothetical protein JSW50_07875 [Candidatus Latescibacterota bacterium]|nr:MAG: hypothetical protein JSW50_07875 [Candidatus Latescibacterota bacterium]